MPVRDKRKWKPNDYLRGREEFNVYPSMNPVLQDMAMMEGKFITGNHFIMLLTLEEARNITDELLGKVDDFFSYKLGPGNIKDGLDGFRTLSKLTTYHDETGKLLVNFNTLKIKAVKYIHRGKVYIKITGYPGVRRILNGTRYGASNPQILEMAIGIRGLAHSIMKGTKFCICCSLAWRTIELIFKSDYDLVDFLVDVTMDVAKIIVSSVVIGISGGVLTLLSSPIVITTVIILFIGFYLNKKLNLVDNENNLSFDLKKQLRNALAEIQRRQEWNQQHLPLSLYLLTNKID
ncbi:hypothetical protein AB1E22_05290 [Buttiauxella gaviniae]|uniref:Uncharacterized protein n=1 Tax=Buttiauxella gaviniae TaxID=82990 RepID=A0ABV3NRK1_9ENTR